MTKTSFSLKQLPESDEHAKEQGPENRNYRASLQLMTRDKLPAIDSIEVDQFLKITTHESCRQVS